MNLATINKPSIRQASNTFTPAYAISSPMPSNPREPFVRYIRGANDRPNTIYDMRKTSVATVTLPGK